MPVLKLWRVLYADNKPFIAAIHVTGHKYITSGPIITSVIVEGEAIEGGVIKTKTGTIYALENPLPENMDCEFARDLLIERAIRYFEKKGTTLKLDQFVELNSLIDKIVAIPKKTKHLEKTPPSEAL